MLPQKVRSRKLRSDGGLRMPCLCRQMHGHAGNTWHHPPDRATPAAAPTSVASWLGTPGAVLVGDRLAASRRRGCSHPGAYHHRVTRCCAGGAAGPPCERRPCVRLGVLSAAHHWQLYPHRTVYIWTTPGSGRTDGISRTPLGPSGPRRRDCWLQGRGGGGWGAGRDAARRDTAAVLANGTDAVMPMPPRRPGLAGAAAAHMHVGSHQETGASVPPAKAHAAQSAQSAQSTLIGHPQP